MENSQTQSKPTSSVEISAIDESPMVELTENCSCNTCGEEFHKPIIAVVSSGAQSEEYYACPRCLSKYKEKERQEIIEPIESEENEQAEETEVELEAEETEQIAGCKYHFGYLKENQKTPIPEDCFVCAQMIECRTHQKPV